MPSVRAGLMEDARAIAAADPAGQGLVATWLSYPGLHAVAAYRLSHRLWGTRWGKPAAQLIAKAATNLTGVSIHPGAVIGRRLFIDHGSEVFIGETSIVGDDVTIYQGASFVGNHAPGRRHAVVGNRVLMGSGAKVIGPVTLGDGAKVGAGAVVTQDVPAGTTAVGLFG